MPWHRRKRGTEGEAGKATQLHRDATAGTPPPPKVTVRGDDADQTQPRPTRPCIMCGKGVVAEGGSNTIASGGNLYACHSARRDCDGAAGSYGTLEKLKRLDEMSADEKERSRVPRGSAESSSATAGSSPLPQDAEAAARRLGELLERYPMKVYKLGQAQGHLMWDINYIDSHSNEEFFQERFEIRQIGRELDRKGGKDLMRAVAHRASEVGPQWVLHHVERLWDGIGEWRP